MPIIFDESSYPVVKISMRGRLEMHEFEAYHAHLLGLMREARQKGSKLGMIVDGRESEPPGANERRVMAKFLEDHTPLMAQSVFGQVIVLSNAIQRGVLTAVLWLRPFPMPHFVAATPEEGVRWLGTLKRSAA